MTRNSILAPRVANTIHPNRPGCRLLSSLNLGHSPRPPEQARLSLPGDTKPRARCTNPSWLPLISFLPHDLARSIYLVYYEVEYRSVSIADGKVQSVARPQRLVSAFAKWVFADTCASRYTVPSPIPKRSLPRRAPVRGGGLFRLGPSRASPSVSGSTP